LQEEKEFIQELLNPKTQNIAFEKLLKDFQKPLYNHIRNIVLNHDDADDVLQNTFIKVKAKANFSLGFIELLLMKR
jgi:DNA-directed RNA polymerase specialized sigma24 family protein